VFTCALAGSLISWHRFSRPSTGSRVLQVAAVLSALFLVAGRDLHGVAGISGTVLGMLLTYGCPVSTDRPKG
jgi:peptidoglycan biosynthesis protein MviN/MurJ (putative lipid II flippase)